jgi:spore coat protein CotF
MIMRNEKLEGMITYMKTPAFGDKEMLTDLLASEKLVTANYNTFANECATPAVRADFVNILTDAHQIQSDIFTEMQKRGWYMTEAANQDKVNAAKQKFVSAKK